MTDAQILEKMIVFSAGNIHDIDHLIRVWTYARTIGELETRPEPLLGRLVAVWERSVRATNDFLPGAERERIKAYVPQALRAVEHLLITENAAGIPIAFMGIENGRLEMLFLAPEERGRCSGGG